MDKRRYPTTPVDIGGSFLGNGNLQQGLILNLSLRVAEARARALYECWFTFLASWLLFDRAIVRRSSGNEFGPELVGYHSMIKSGCQADIGGTRLIPQPYAPQQMP
jgi:hypothetical protein